MTGSNTPRPVLTLADHAGVFLIGAVAGLAYDYIHVYYGVTAYAHPDFHGTVLKVVPAQFGLCAAFGGWLMDRLALALPPPRVSGARTAFDLALLFVAYMATGLLAGQNGATFAALFPIAFLSVATRPARFVLAVSGAAAIAGPVGEIVLRHAGFFHYVHADPVPVWLPLLWVVAAGGFLDVPMMFRQRRLDSHARG